MVERILLALVLALPACKATKRTEGAPSASVSSSARAAKSAAPPASVAKPPRPADAIAETGAGLVSLVGDATHVFWMSDGYRGAIKGILSLAKSGGEPTRLAGVHQAQGLWATTGQLYFYDAGPELFALPKSGGRPKSILENDALGPAAAEGDAFCYIGPPSAPGAGAKPSRAAPAGGPPRAKVLKSDERALRCRKDGAEGEVEVGYATLYSSVILVSGDHVFWPLPLEGTIQAAPVVGGRGRSLLRDTRSITAMAANKSSLFFVGTYKDDLGLFVVGKKGGTPRKLVALKALTRQLAADDENVYYAVKGSLWRVPLRKGEPTALFQDEPVMPAGLLVDDGSVYLADGFYLRRFRKP